MNWFGCGSESVRARYLGRLHDNRDQPMPELYDRVIANEPGSTGTIREADVVVINLGTNDYSTDGDLKRPGFTGDRFVCVRRRSVELHVDDSTRLRTRPGERIPVARVAVDD